MKNATTAAVGKGKQIRLITTDKNKEQVDFVHKPNQNLIIESRSNLTVGLYYSCYEWIIESTNRIIFPFMNRGVRAHSCIMCNQGKMREIRRFVLEFKASLRRRPWSVFQKTLIFSYIFCNSTMSKLQKIYGKIEVF